MEEYLEKVRLHAYRITDADVDALRAAHSEDAIFEATVSVAVAAGLERLDAALAAVGGPR
jgi:alkylhydroperoxidase family enzyme